MLTANFVLKNQKGETISYDTAFKNFTIYRDAFDYGRIILNHTIIKHILIYHEYSNGKLFMYELNQENHNRAYLLFSSLASKDCAHGSRLHKISPIEIGEPTIFNIYEYIVQNELYKCELSDTND